jgi:hypothetical protein
MPGLRRLSGGRHNQNITLIAVHDYTMLELYYQQSLDSPEADVRYLTYYAKCRAMSRSARISEHNQRLSARLGDDPPVKKAAIKPGWPAKSRGQGSCT